MENKHDAHFRRIHHRIEKIDVDKENIPPNGNAGKYVLKSHARKTYESNVGSKAGNISSAFKVPRNGKSKLDINIKSDVIEGAVATVRSVPVAHLTQDLNALDIQEEGQEKIADAANDKFEGKVLEYMQTIVNISHRQAGANADESAAAGRRRAKMLIERHEQVKTFVRMVLRDYPYIDSLKMINMIDYCSMWFQSDSRSLLMDKTTCCGKRNM